MKLFSHNLLKNKELLRDMLKQIDLLNTINGGSAQTSVDVVGNLDSIIIKVSAPTVPSEAFNVLLDYTKLTVSIFAKEEIDYIPDKLHLPAVAPVFMKTFDLPAFVDLDKIEAFHENNELKVILPFRDTTESLQRLIDIKEK
jgi:HSP20 family protein